jgi:hypothetical protein
LSYALPPRATPFSDGNVLVCHACPTPWPRCAASGLLKTRNQLFDNRGNSVIVGIDEFAVRAFLPLREAFGLYADVRMGTHRGGERLAEPLTLCIRQYGGLCKTLMGLLATPLDGCTEFQQPLFGLSNQLDVHVTVAATPATKAPHDFFQLLCQVLDLALELGGALAPLPAHGANDLERFFGLYTAWWHL